MRSRSGTPGARRNRRLCARPLATTTPRSDSSRPEPVARHPARRAWRLANPRSRRWAAPASRGRPAPTGPAADRSRSREAPDSRGSLHARATHSRRAPRPPARPWRASRRSRSHPPSCRSGTSQPCRTTLERAVTTRDRPMPDVLECGSGPRARCGQHRQGHGGKEVHKRSSCLSAATRPLLLIIGALRRHDNEVPQAPYEGRRRLTKIAGPRARKPVPVRLCRGTSLARNAVR